MNITINNLDITSIRSVDEIDYIIGELANYRDELEQNNAIENSRKQVESDVKSFLDTCASNDTSDVYLFIPESMWEDRYEEEVGGVTGKIFSVRPARLKNVQTDEDGDVIIIVKEDL